MILFWLRLFRINKTNTPSWACIEVLHIFVSCLTLQFLHGACKILYAWKFNCLQNSSMQHTKSDCSTHVSVFTENSMQHVKVSMHISNYYMQSKICHRDDFFISEIFYWAPGKVSYAADVSHEVKIGHFSINWAIYWSKKKSKNAELICWSLKTRITYLK